MLFFFLDTLQTKNFFYVYNRVAARQALGGRLGLNKKLTDHYFVFFWWPLERIFLSFFLSHSVRFFFLHASERIFFSIWTMPSPPAQMINGRPLIPYSYIQHPFKLKAPQKKP